MSKLGMIQLHQYGTGQAWSSVEGTAQKPVINTDNCERMLFFCVFSFTFESFTSIIVLLLAVVSTWPFATGDIIGFSRLFKAVVEVCQLLFGLYGQDLLT
ncbi:MAG: hypothetical protein ACYS9C_13165 [Planctomycetota bacterium]|jgi:hypothetical protein